ncbi:hypothetical protein [Burkholderia vietnamiensis]|uniref:hypothetical protein n=1 Tax=Burkholderia vietnamiensis TaxID=60552 RepID=UPI001CF294B9|nr:hypothetical protein [Burkholderia vietnamiensis]MCA8148123.1 hypothetical protein [Burkholderia vietnamiensis]
MLATVGIVIVIAVLFVLFGVLLKRVHDKRADRAAFEAETVRRASAVAAAEANKAKADQAVRDALANPLIGDATRH